MIRDAAVIIILFSVGFFNMPELPAEEYYVEDFESSKEYLMTEKGSSGKSLVKFNGTVSQAYGEKSYSGNKALKLDLILPVSPNASENSTVSNVYSYWKTSGKDMRIPLKTPVYLSGFIYFPLIDQFKDVDVKIGFEVEGTLKSVNKHCRGTAPIKKMKHAGNGWWFQEIDLRKELIEEGPWAEDTVFLNWYINIAGKEKFKGERLTFYIDDIKISSEKKEMPGLSGYADRPEISGEDSYTVKYMSAFRDRLSGAKNLIDNSSFELDTKNWGISGAGEMRCWDIDKAQCFHGTKSLKLYCGKGNTAGSITIDSQVIPVKEGAEYVFSGYLKSEETGTMVRINGTPLKLTTDWQRYEILFKNIHWNRAGYYSIKIDYNGKAAVWIDALQLEKGVRMTGYELPESLEAGISTSKKINVYDPEESVTLIPHIHNGHKKTIAVNAGIQIKDFENKTVANEKYLFDLKSGETKDYPLNLELPPGFYKAVLSVSSENSEQKESRCSFAILENPENNRERIYSYGSFHYGSSSDFLFSVDRYLMSDYVKFFHVLSLSDAPRNWRNNNPQWAVLDKKLELLKKYNEVPIIDLSGLPSWLDFKRKSAGSPEDPEKLSDKVLKEWKDYTYAVVKKYSDRVKYWDIWSEFVRHPIRIDAKMYVKLLRIAYETIKDVDPDAKVIGLGAENSGPSFTMDYQKLLFKAEEVFKLGGLSYMDIVSIHPYGPFYTPEELDYSGMLCELKKLIRKYNLNNEKPVWITEVGWRGIDTLYYDLSYGEGNEYSKFVTEREQAENLVRMNIISIANGITHFFPFVNYAGSYTNIFAYSLFENDFISPKPGLAAWNNMANILKEASYEKEIKISDGIKCYKFNTKNDAVFVLWNWHKNKETKLFLDVPEENFRIINMVGSTLKTPIKRPFPLNLTGSPVYVTGNSIELEKAFLNCRRQGVSESPNGGLKGKLFFDGTNLTLSVENEKDENLNEQIEFILPCGWHAGKTAFQAQLAPHEKKEYSISFTEIKYSPLTDVISAISSANGKDAICTLKPVCCLYAKIVDKGNIPDKEWEKCIPIKLKEESVGGYDWRGENDLSASIRSLWNEDNLYFKIEVSDNEHFQPYHDSRIWAGDSLQIGFDTLCDTLPGAHFDINDYEYGFALTEKGAFSYIWSGNHIMESQVDSIEMKIKRGNNKTIYEISFPWKTIAPFVPAPGKSLRFNICIMDNDGDGLKHYMQISDGLAGQEGKNPSLFRNLVLLRSK